MIVDQAFGVDLIDFGALAAWMTEQGLGRSAIEEVVPLTGGSQNIIVRFERDGRSYVVRRPPLHPTADGNKTMRREARVLGALAGSDVPHPHLIAACEDETVIGAAFYLMEPVDGFNAGVGLPPLHAGDPAIRHGMGLAMVEGIARLGRVDWQAVGLAGYGNPEGFLERQVPRWSHQLESYGKHDGWPGLSGLPDVGQIARWLEEHRPASFVPGILHGDFHIKNVMFRNDGPELAAIIDWELATVGDPLLDLGWMLATWRDQDAPASEAQIVVEPWDGFPTPAELIAHYGATSGRDVGDANWYAVLACYKLAILLEGTFARACAGKAPAEIGARMHASAIRLLGKAGRIAAG
ncbi:phosphotransferase family protein [Sphingomonas sp. BAUL-RG-20F-R05-02]|uniref:phosphotransferase family protein n=1 Tax=Sphingomonas sp. BAUL-RG-20F-R05-02 TaxID=2914830 RepID=UPI001F58EC0E|nr:phosphotransferase family protein [Sphingomonas sp. BAUL-RG-20F-R05-02]